MPRIPSKTTKKQRKDAYSESVAQRTKSHQKYLRDVASGKIKPTKSKPRQNTGRKSSTWWSSKSLAAKKAYLKAHPNSNLKLR